MLGETIGGRYRVEELIGEGGFGQVFAAVDLRSGRSVAIKVHRGRHEGPDRLRFDRELAVLRGLHHPNIVELLDGGTTSGGTPYAVFERLEGAALSDVLRGRPFTADEAEHILRQLLSALTEAHRHRLLHRDIKPENVFVCEGDDLHVKLIDFGIARVADDGSPAITRTGELVGTPRYMSPEQIRGKPLTPASDLYSLGLVVIEMVLGRASLHGGAWLDQLDRLQAGHRFDTSGMERLGPRLQAVVDHVTAHDADKRPQSAEAVLELLDGPRPRRALAWMGGIASVAAVLLLGGVLANGDDRPPAVSPVKRPLVVTTEAPPDVASRDASGRERPADCDAPLDFRGTWQGRRRIELEMTIPFSGFVPTTGNGPWPLVVLIADRAHVDADKLMTSGGFLELAEEHDFAIVAPDLPLRDGLDRDTAGALIREFVDQVIRGGCVDSERVFVVGHIQGAQVAEQLACDPWVKGVAIASHVGRQDPECTVPTPAPRLNLVPMASLHHIPDATGRLCQGNRQDRTLDDVEAELRKSRNCKPTPKPMAGYGPACREWSCKSRFASCRIPGGQQWSGFEPKRDADQRCEGPRHEFPSAAVAWDFFARLQLH